MSEVAREARLRLKHWKSVEQDGLPGIAEVEIRKIVRDVLLGLRELHQENIVHLDLKPGNILRGKSGKYKLADLGMARFIVKVTEAESIPEGDTRYLSRELVSKQVAGELPDLKKADIYSLGITAYELVTLN